MTVSDSSGRIDLGLSRIENFLSQKLPQDPRHKLRIVHVSGTNGKGSTCALISSALEAGGYKVGTFNSPHFHTPSDSVRIQNRPVDDNEYRKLRDWIRTLDSTNAAHEQLTLFEQTTVAALWHFAENSVDIAVIEVGLGGLRDATNVFGAPGDETGESLVQCICPIDRDHVGVIGNTVEEIAAEKAGIMRRGAWIVLGNQSHIEAFHCVRKAAHSLSPGHIVSVRSQPTSNMHVSDFIAPAHLTKLTAQRCQPQWAAFNGTGRRCLRVKYPPTLDVYFGNGLRVLSKTAEKQKRVPHCASLDLPLTLHGYYQATNAGIAFYCLDILRTHYGFDRLTDSAIQAGFISVNWPGRLAWLDLNTHSELSTEAVQRWVLADGAHNEAAAIELRKYIDNTLNRIKTYRHVYESHEHDSRRPLPVRWVVGMTQGKDVAGILHRLVHAGDEIWAVPFSKPEEMPWINSMDPKAIIEVAREIDGVVCVAFDELQDAVAQLRNGLGDFLNVLCGSLYLVADLYKLLGVDPFEN